MDFLFIGLLFIGVMWFMTSRTRKQQAAALAFRDSLEPGQEVMTIGRMYATVLEVDENRVTLELSDGVVGVWDKDGIARLVEPPVADDDEFDDDDELADSEYDDEEYDDEYDEDVDDELDTELDSEDLDDVLAEDAEDEASIDDQIDEALLAEDGADDEVVAEETDEAWSEVDVPDDASSLIDPGEDPKKPR